MACGTKPLFHNRASACPYFPTNLNFTERAARSAWTSSRRKRSSCASTPTISSSRNSTDLLSSTGGGLDAHRRITGQVPMLLRRSFVQQGGRNGAARRPKGWSSPADTCRAAFSCRRAKKPPLMLSGGQTVKGPRRVCACGRKESPIIFFGDMCGEENTSQAASVEFVRNRLQPPLSKSNTF